MINSGQNTTVDVIIPTYNNVVWLERTLDSVLRQTHRNLKIYVVDDGSTDDTKTMIQSIRDERIHYIWKKNGGVSSARNAGIKRSNSDFVAFLDADDMWEPTKIEKQLKMMLSDDSIGLVYGHHYTINEDNIVLGSLRTSETGRLFDKLVNGNIIAGSASMVLIRRKILQKAGYFREDFINGEDWHMWLKISRLCDIAVVPEILASIRVHPGGSQQQREKMADALVYAYPIIRDDLNLNQSQQRLLASYCLFNSMVTYESVRKYDKALRTMQYLFQENPPAKNDKIHWKVQIGYGIYLRILLNSPFFSPFRQIKNTILYGFVFLEKLVRLPFKIFYYHSIRAKNYFKRTINHADKK